MRCLECGVETAEATPACVVCGVPGPRQPAASAWGGSRAWVKRYSVRQRRYRAKLDPAAGANALAGHGGTADPPESDAAGWAAPTASRASAGQQPSESAPDSEVDGAIFAEWVEARNFATTRLRPGYDKEEVDAFLNAIRDTFLGMREPSLTPDEIRNKQFSTTRLRPGYDEEEVDAFLDETESRLAAQVRARETPVALQRPVVMDPAQDRSADSIPPPHELAGQRARPGSGWNARVIAYAGLTALMTVIVGILIANSSTSSRSAPPTSAPPTIQASYDELLPGNCLEGSDLGLGTSNAWPNWVTVVRCTQQHIAEVFFAGDAWPPSLAYPGDNALDSRAVDRCDIAFAAYDGVTFDESAFSYDYMYPTDAVDWSSGDRRLVCIAYESTAQQPGGAPVDYSIKGSDQ